MNEQSGEAIDAGRPHGTPREEFLALIDGKMTDWIEAAEKVHGLLERIATVTLNDGRIIMLGRFEKAWYMNLFNPGNKPSERDIQCFLSFEAMCALWGLHQYLTTPHTHEQAWQAFMEAIEGSSETQESVQGAWL